MLRGISTHKKGKGKGFQQKPPNINLPPPPLQQKNLYQVDMLDVPLIQAFFGKNIDLSNKGNLSGMHPCQNSWKLTFGLIRSGHFATWQGMGCEVLSNSLGQWSNLLDQMF